MEDEVVQTSILLCAESDKDNTTESYGRDCTAQFLECLESLAVDLDGDDRSLISVFHNLKGYDGIFLLQHCYANYREVSKSRTGYQLVKYCLSSQTDRLCFLPFTPSTLGIKEATELMEGSQGTRSNQSVKAYKWLAWQEHLLRRDSPSSSNDEPQADRIRHAGSGGE